MQWTREVTKIRKRRRDQPAMQSQPYGIDARANARLQLASGSTQDNCIDSKPTARLELACGSSAEDNSAPSGILRHAKVPSSRSTNGDTTEGYHSSKPGAIRVHESNRLPEEDDEWRERAADILSP
jgi:hypothetical protein